MSEYIDATDALEDSVKAYATGAGYISKARKEMQADILESGAEASKLEGIAGVSVALRELARERGWVKRSTGEEKDYTVAVWVRDCGISKSAATVLWNASLRVALHRDWSDIETQGAQSAVFDALGLTTQAGLLRLIKPQSEVVRGILVTLANGAISAGFGLPEALQMIEDAPMGDHDLHVVRQARKDAAKAVATKHTKK